MPNRQLNAPIGPKPPQFIPRMNQQQPVPTYPAQMNNALKQPVPATPNQPATQQKIPMPNEMKGVILAPQNKPAQSKETIKE